MKRILGLAAIAAGVLLAFAACASAPKSAGPFEFKADAVTVLSRGVQIPAVLTVPAANARVPLVVMAHGHGGSKDENGGFTSIAEALARKGIASIRMDFPGCGQSVEPFTQNNLTNMLADIEAAQAYAIANAPIDQTKVGMFGYSMGGRLAILATQHSTYKSLGLLAPVGLDGSEAMFGFMGGSDKYAELAMKAASDGHVQFTTPFGQVQDLGAQWFTDNEAAKVLSAIGMYRGPVLFVHGDADTTITERVVVDTAAAATKSVGVKMVTINGADHGYGFYGGDPRLKTQTVEAVTDFFSQTLR